MPFLNLTQAAKAAGVSRTTLYKKIKNGSLSTVKDMAGNKAVDTSELLRVFGNLRGLSSTSTEGERNNGQGLGMVDGDSVQGGIIQALREQLAVVSKELGDCKDREKRLLSLLETKLLTTSQQGKVEPTKAGKPAKKKKGKK